MDISTYPPNYHIDPKTHHVIYRFRNDVLDLTWWISYLTTTKQPLQKDAFILLCKIMKAEMAAQPNVVSVDLPVNICGDIHGQYRDLLRIFDIGGSPMKCNYVFLGDFVDRGLCSLQVIQLLFLAWLLYRDRITLLRGNHESLLVGNQYNFKTDCIEMYATPYAFEKCCEVFNVMPISALVADSVFCVHGGLSPMLRTIDQVSGLCRFRECCCIQQHEDGFEDLLWADPREDNELDSFSDDEYIPSKSGFSPNSRGCSYVFDAEITRAFVVQNDLKLICRAHQVVMEGIYFMHDGLLVTVWSAPNYCGRGNRAVVLNFEKPDLVPQVFYFERDPNNTDTLDDERFVNSYFR